MTTITAKIADLTTAAESIYANIHTAAGEAEAKKIRKLAAKMEVGFETALMTVLVKKIGYGAIKMDGWWFPVVAGEVIANRYQFSTAAMSHTASAAVGITVKF
jgi:hypothetical protein